MAALPRGDWFTMPTYSSRLNTFCLRFCFLCAFICMGLAGLSVPLFAQTTSGDLVGTILDPSGAGIPNARVEVTNVDTGVTTAATTNDKGAYRFGNLLIGRYDVTTKAPGFSPSSRRGIQILLNST